MVPADDEHKSANEADSNTSTKEREPGRLTPMPNWLMKWWTPLALAILLLIICTPIAFWWGGSFHWPSSTAMTLCATIVGTGFAFSAWQQRSHDNAANAKQAQATVEREDYWKRREQIFQILASNNPGLRLGAVALLAELADSAANRTQLSITEIQQLQKHIIDTLCLQMRHEALNLTDEGTLEEHAEIQRAIFQVFLERIQNRKAEQGYANWSSQYINLQHCNILTKVTISQIQTNATLDFRDSVFQEQVEISESHIGRIFWQTAYFRKQLVTAGGKNSYQNRWIAPTR